jgi:S-adenosylmethionine hydrolase
MSRPLVTFTTDFGLDDWFVGVMHAVVHERCPECRIVDLTHQVPPGDIERAAFVLEAAIPDIHGPAVHVVVVDPGVGTGRRAIVVRARGSLFVAPDNGVLEWALAGPQAETREITAHRLFREPVSRTFHGRDVFAPIAARLATGGAEAFTAVGRGLGVPARLEPVHAGAVDRSHADLVAEIARGSRLATRVAHVDRFGNVILHLRGNALLAWLGDAAARDLVMRAHGAGGAKVTVVRGLAETYAGARPAGQPFALIGSSGLLEIALAGGHAALTLGLAPGDAVDLTLEPRG